MAKIIVLGSHPESFINFRYDMLATMALTNEVIACAPNASSEIINDLARIKVKYHNIKLYRTGLNPFYDFMTMINLYKLFKILNPDIVMAYTGKPVIYGSLAAKLSGVKHIYSIITGVGSYFIHNDFKSRLVRFIIILLYKLSLSYNNKVFFQNPDDISDFSKLLIFKDPSRTVLINGSGVNINYYTPKNFPKNIRFLMISRFIKSKGIMEYLNAARLLKNKYPQVIFMLVGWFENKKETLSLKTLQEYIDERSIEYLGKLDDVRIALDNCSVYVLPSYREGIPKSVLEAMACGRAIITTDVPGCRETVYDNGFLVPVKNIMALGLAMEKFILQPHLIDQMGKRSRVIAENKFAVEKVNKVILESIGLNDV